MGMAAESQFHILAVDDSIVDRKLIERLLKTSFYQVTAVDSGSKALEFLGLNEHDDSSNPSSPNHHRVEVNLVITDYCMPGMSGYDLLKKIKESSLLRNIPVVIMSSENVPSRITRCLEEGAEEFFLKPMKLSDVDKLRPHVMKSMIRKGDRGDQQAESRNTEIQSQPQLEEQPQSKKRKLPAEEDDEISSSARMRSLYGGLAVVL